MSQAAANIPPRLRRAWRLTDYRAAGIAIRLDRRAPDALLLLLGVRTAALVTAWNPRSRRRPDGWNRRMQLRLRQCLSGFTVIEAQSRLHRWCEAMLLVGGDPRPVVRIAARFRQHAVVVLRRGGTTQLRLV